MKLGSSRRPASTVAENPMRKSKTTTFANILLFNSNFFLGLFIYVPLLLCFVKWQATTELYSLADLKGWRYIAKEIGPMFSFPFIEEIYYAVITLKNGFVRVLLSVIVLFVLYKFKLFTSSKSLLALRSALSLVINYLIIFSLRIWTIMSSLNIRLDKGLSHNYFI